MRTYLLAWVLMLLVSIANGAVRNFTYGKQIDKLTAHQSSSVSSVLLLGVVTWGYVCLYPPASHREAVLIGLPWMILTIAFELVILHYVGSPSWLALFANYNVLEGRVWVVVLLWLATAPYSFIRLRRPA